MTDQHEPQISVPAAHDPIDESAIYTVQEGDRLWDIAERLTGNPADYRKLAHDNGIMDPDLIHPGQRIRIPQQHLDSTSQGSPPGTAANPVASNVSSNRASSQGVLSGDVRHLRRLANHALPTVADGFADASKILDTLGDMDRVLDHDDIDSAALKTAWNDLREGIQRIAAENATSLQSAATAVNAAADAFIERDGLNATEIDKNIPHIDASDPVSPDE